MKTLLFLFILLPKLSTAQDDTHDISYNTSTPQTAVVKPLQIGDAVPDVALNNMLNYKTTAARLSHFKGKLIILDFFATWCGSCIKELPKLDSLQKQFGSSIQVLVSSYQPLATIKAFISTNKNAKAVSLPFITGDTTLTVLFPHRMLPHQVWINAAGRVVAITYAQEVTAKNIQSALAGRQLNLPVKRDAMDYNREQPLLVNNNGGTEESMLYRSVFTKYLNGVAAMSGPAKTATGKKITYINHSVISLYAAATGRPKSNRIILDVEDASRYIYSGTNVRGWSVDNKYCYELYVPATATSRHMKASMQQDLDRYLGINSMVKDTLVKCWALVKLSKETTLQASAANTGFNQEEPFTAVVTNQPVSKLVTLLNTQISAKPLRPIIVNETGYNGLVNIRLKSDLFNTEAVAEELKAFGFTLLPVERELDMLVLSDKSRVNKSTD